MTHERYDGNLMGTLNAAVCRAEQYATQSQFRAAEDGYEARHNFVWRIARAAKDLDTLVLNDFCNELENNRDYLELIDQYEKFAKLLVGLRKEYGVSL